MTVDLCIPYMLMLVLMQGHRNAKTQRCMLSATKQAISITLPTMVGHFYLTLTLTLQTCIWIVQLVCVKMYSPLRFHSISLYADWKVTRQKHSLPNKNQDNIPEWFSPASLPSCMQGIIPMGHRFGICSDMEVNKKTKKHTQRLKRTLFNQD